MDGQNKRSHNGLEDMSGEPKSIHKPVQRKADSAPRSNSQQWNHNFVLREGDVQRIERSINFYAGGHSDNQQRDSRAQRTIPK